jgi:hypothetical protein
MLWRLSSAEYADESWQKWGVVWKPALVLKSFRRLHDFNTSLENPPRTPGFPHLPHNIPSGGLDEKGWREEIRNSDLVEVWKTPLACA